MPPLTDLGASHCLGLASGRAPQGATGCRSALKSTQPSPRTHTMLSRWRHQPQLCRVNSFSPSLSRVSPFPAPASLSKASRFESRPHMSRAAGGPSRLLAIPAPCCLHTKCVFSSLGLVGAERVAVLKVLWEVSAARSTSLERQCAGGSGRWRAAPPPHSLPPP